MLSGALLGAGNIARNGHLPAYLSSAEVRARLRITAVADLCAENLAIMAEALPGVRTYADPETLLREESPDFVDICTPPYAHADLIALALAAGCHIVCEKPLSTDLQEALEIRAWAATARRVLFPCHQYHYAPQWLAMREVIDSGDLGVIRAAELVVERTGANAGAAGWQPLWRTQQKLAGGGILVDHGTHLFYQLHALFGPPETIACTTERRLPGYTVDDTAEVTLLYPQREVRLRLTWAGEARRSTHRYSGERGEMICLDDNVRVRDRRGERVITFDQGLAQGSAHSEWFAPLLLEFAARIDAGDFRTDRLDEAVLTAAYITRAYASAAESGRPLSWRDPLPEPAVESFAAAD